jgi:hypothetical protein
MGGPPVVLTGAGALPAWANGSYGSGSGYGGYGYGDGDGGGYGYGGGYGGGPFVGVSVREVCP